MKIIVTGSQGFIGSNLIKLLQSYGHEIRGIDLKEGYDVRNLPLMLELTKGYDAVVHLAGFLSESESRQDPRGYIDHNFMGTLNMLEASRINKIPKFIMASSAACREPLNPYAYSKCFSETMCNFYANSGYIKNVYPLRFFNAFGVGMNYGVIKLFMNKILKGEPIIIYGDGESIRDYTHVNDISKTILSFLLSNSDNATYEVGSGVGTSTNELARMCAFAMNGDLNYEITHIDTTTPEIRKSIAETPIFKYMIPLDEGLKDYAENLKKNQS